MDYFVNYFEDVNGSYGNFRSYKLYSGKTISDIKSKIVFFIKDYWGDSTDDFDSLNRDTDLDFSGISKFAMNVLNDEEYEGVDNALIEISEPYTEISKAVQFYCDYLDDKDNEDGYDFEHIDFTFRGDRSMELEEKNILFLSSLIRDHDLYLDDKIIEKITSRIK